MFDSWVNTDPDAVFRALANGEELFLSEEYGPQFREARLELDGADLFQRLIAQEDVASSLGRLEQLSPAMEQEQSPSPERRRGPIVPARALVPLVSEKFIAEYGSLHAALNAARELPQTPSQERVVMDLTASSLVQEALAGAAQEGAEQVLSPELGERFLGVIDSASPAGREQFRDTIRFNLFASQRTRAGLLSPENQMLQAVVSVINERYPQEMGR